MRKRYLVTGATGFIGGALCRHLSSVGAAFTAVDRQGFKKLKRIFMRLKPQVIFHLAGGRPDVPQKMITNNVLTIIELFDTIQTIAGYHPRVIIVGSASEYGNRARQSKPITEDSATVPGGLYGWVKLMGTQTALHYAQQGEDVVVARLFNILGPGTPDSTAPGRFAREITAQERQLCAKPFTVADLRGVRDFMDIRDVCRALVILAAKAGSGEIYNICSQRQVPMRQLLSAMIAYSRNPAIRYKEDRHMKPGVLYSVGSSAKFRRLSHWQTQYNLRQSLIDTLAYYRNKSISS